MKAKDKFENHSKKKIEISHTIYVDYKTDRNIEVQSILTKALVEKRKSSLS